MTLKAAVRGLSAILFLGSFGPPTAFAEPAQVVIFRHAEKPAAGPELNAKGRQRAAALVPYILETPELNEFKAPAAVYAQKSTDKHLSKRPVDTIKAAAQALKLELILFIREDAAAMVKEIRAKPEYDGKTVIICWSHRGIPDMARAFGVAEAPDWPDAAFDRTWIIRTVDGKAVLRDLPQQLMYGDSAK